jgi:deazaflavin-dependent oxidoreductase (nitroreductase family)
MQAVNRRVAGRILGGGRGPRGVVLLLTTTGRRSGLPRTTPLQYEEEPDGLIRVMSARGAGADWFANATADPQVIVQVGDRRFAGTAEAVISAERIADFLELRIGRRPAMMRLMLATEGVPPWAGRARLVRLAATKAMLAIRPDATST